MPPKKALKTVDLESSLDEVSSLLTSLNWLDPNEEIIRTEKPGEGNMNVVMRVVTTNRSFILKQSRPYIQKFQDLAAPIERIEVENRFYQAVGEQVSLPKILAYTVDHHLMMVEDLGEASDLTSIYPSRKIDKETVSTLLHTLSSIHSVKPIDFPSNLELRQLNHQHIFVLPFLEENGFQLDNVQPGLQALSRPYKKDERLKSIVKSIGDQYLSQGDVLLHGDYYPGSWLDTQNGIKVIDPEFGFMGFAEFDLGVMTAHLIIGTGDIHWQEQVVKTYAGNPETSLIQKVAGIEIMRRLIGLAQLPLDRSIEEKDQLLKHAHQMILD